MSRSPASAHTELAPMSTAQRVGYRVLRAVLEAFCRVMFRISIDGRERLPVTGPFIFSPVHRSNIDFMIAAVSVPRVMRFMGKNSVWKPAWFGRFLDFLGGFPVDRDRVDRAALRNCETAISQGYPVVMFPEGRRMEGLAVHELQEGPAWVACRLRVPIVPVGFARTDDAMPIGAKMLRPVRVRVVIGEPIYPDVPVSGRVPRGAVAALTQQLHDEVQKYYDEARST